MLVAWITWAIAAPPSALTLPVESYRLDNGMQVILQPDPRYDSAAYSLRYGVGAVNDPPDRRGMAHLVEHLMFDRVGGAKRGFFDELEAHGVTGLNAFTTLGHTEYSGLVPPTSLPYLLWMEAARMQKLEFDDAALAREREVVVHELYERRYDQPFGRAETILLQSLFPAPHRLHYGPAGFGAHMREATRADVLEFHGDHYLPPNAVLVIAGGFDVPRTKAAIAEYFGPVPAGRPRSGGRAAAPRLAKEPQYAPELTWSQSRITFVWSAPPMNDPRSRQLEVLAQMIPFRLLVANLFERSLEGLLASFYPTPTGRLFRLDALVSSGASAGLVRGRVRSIIETYVWVEPQEKELEAAKKALERGLYARLDSLPGRVALYQDLHAQLGDVRAARKLLDAWRDVTAPSILDALRTTLVGEPMVLVTTPAGQHR